MNKPHFISQFARRALAFHESDDHKAADAKWTKDAEGWGTAAGLPKGRETKITTFKPTSDTPTSSASPQGARQRFVPDQVNKLKTAKAGRRVPSTIARLKAARTKPATESLARTPLAYDEDYGAATGKLTVRPTKTPLDAPQAREGARVQGYVQAVQQKANQRNTAWRQRTQAVRPVRAQQVEQRTPLAFDEVADAPAKKTSPGEKTKPTASMADGGKGWSAFERAGGGRPKGKAGMGTVAPTHHDPLVNSVNTMSLMRQVLHPTHAVHLVRMPDGALLVRGVDKEKERAHLQGRGLHPHQDHAHSAYDAMHVHHDGRTGQVIHRMEQEQKA